MLEPLPRPRLSGREHQAAENALRKHFLSRNDPTIHSQPWMNLPELPTKAEMVPPAIQPSSATRFDDKPQEWDEYQHDPVYSATLPHNIVNGPWPSREAYVGAHYQILREDGIAPLRKAIEQIRFRPEMGEEDDTCIYTDVRFTGIQLSRIGPAWRVTFSCERTGKRIRWEQSKRLMQGTIVALTTRRDMFRSILKIAVVAARPIEGGLDQNPPTVDLFWADSNEAEIDLVEEYIMVESRNGYFEANRHTLVAMQRLMNERFKLADQLVFLDQDVGAPGFIEAHPFMDMSSLVEAVPSDTDLLLNVDESLENINVLEGFPKGINSGMDSSQMKAMEHMLTRQVAVVQGPPGTGKTFVSIKAVCLICKNQQPEDPVLVISAQTNHALDQLLNHIMVFEPNIVRLGGRSNKENEEILKRTLYQLRVDHPEIQDGRSALKVAFTAWTNIINKLKTVLEPLLTGDIMSAHVLHKYKIISETQYSSLLQEEGWSSSSSGWDVENMLLNWVGDDQLMYVPRTRAVNLGLPLEDSDIDYEQLQENEGEMAEEPADKSDIEHLTGEFMPFGRKTTGKHTIPGSVKNIKSRLRKFKDLYEFPKGDRGEVYRHFEKQLNDVMLRELRTILREYQDVVDNYQYAKGMCNVKLVKSLGIKVIGCTTTGLSKYRGFLSACGPRTLLIEEAAETLEAKIIGGLFDSLEQLILVGDHQQLQATCTIAALEGAPYNMNISMFERLVNNSIEYVMLNRQRRMIPEIRELLCIPNNPFYKNLHDHESVLDREVNRPIIPGMAADSLFFHHIWPEAVNSDGSKYNFDEAEMIAGTFNHLVMNGTPPEKITCLTFYNGQRKTLLKELRKFPVLSGTVKLNVFTVDSYQGEENDVILLSLVRSSNSKGIGFLDNRNRLVVALSRARRGLYIFGNSVTLTLGETKTDEGVEVVGRDPLWDPLVLFLASKGRLCFDWGLPITCKNHENIVFIEEAQQWLGRAGGCDEPCTYGIMECGHPCTQKCHPYDHSLAFCPAACVRILSCGHGCSKYCGEICFCDQCMLRDGDFARPEESSNSIGDVRVEDPEWFNRGESPSPSPTKGDLRKQAHSRGHSKLQQFDDHTDGRTFSAPFCGEGKPISGSRGDVLSDGHNQMTTSRSRERLSSSLAKTTQVQAWNTWDAQQDDEKLAERRRREQAAWPQSNLSPLEFTEIHKNIEVKDGFRKQLSRTTRRVIGREGSKDGSNSVSGELYAELLGAQQTAQPLQKAPSEWPKLTANLATSNDRVCPRTDGAPSLSYAQVSAAPRAQAPVSAFNYRQTVDRLDLAHRGGSIASGFDTSSEAQSKMREELLREKDAQAIKLKRSEKSTKWAKLEAKPLHTSSPSGSGPRTLSNANKNVLGAKLLTKEEPSIMQTLKCSSTGTRNHGVPDLWKSSTKSKSVICPDKTDSRPSVITSADQTPLAHLACADVSVLQIPAIPSVLGADATVLHFSKLENSVALSVENRLEESTADKPMLLIEFKEDPEMVNAKNTHGFFGDDLISFEDQ